MVKHAQTIHQLLHNSSTVAENCLRLFEHFVGLVLKWLKEEMTIVSVNKEICTVINHSIGSYFDIKINLTIRTFEQHY